MVNFIREVSRSAFTLLPPMQHGSYPTTWRQANSVKNERTFLTSAENVGADEKRREEAEREEDVEGDYI